MTKAIVIVHGLFMNPLVMKFLEKKFRDLGYKPYHYSYATVKFSEKTIHGLKHLVDTLKEDECYFLGHSMGGLVCKRFLMTYHSHLKHKFSKISLVTLGTPHQSSVLAKTINMSPLKPIFGTAGESGIIDKHPTWNIDIPLGCIAGSTPFGLIGLIPQGFRPESDGTVLVNEAFDMNASDTKILPVSHTSMLFSEDIVKESHHFFQHESFQCTK